MHCPEPPSAFKHAADGHSVVVVVVVWSGPRPMSWGLGDRSCSGWWCISLCSATTAAKETKTVHTRLTNKQTNEQGRNNLMGIVKIEICYSNYIIANLFTFLICLLCAWHGQGRREFLGHSSGHIRCGFIRIM